MNKNLIIPAWMIVLNNVEDNKKREKIAIDSYIGFNYSSNVLKKFIRLGLLKKGEKKGRMIPLTLTQKGEKIKFYVNKLIEEIKEVEDE